MDGSIITIPLRLLRSDPCLSCCGRGGLQDRVGDAGSEWNNGITDKCWNKRHKDVVIKLD